MNPIQFPLVSILLPVLNAEKYLAECLESIKTQTYKNWELIIANDGSSDGSERIIENFIKDSSNQIKYLSFVHSGLPFCLNKGVEVASGKYIARMDADDIMLPNRLAVQVDFLENNPKIDILGGQAIEIDESGIEFSVIKKPIFDSEIKKELVFSCPLVHPTVMLRKEILQKNLYKEIYPNSEDSDLWRRLAKTNTFRNVDAILIKKRFHENQITQNSRIFKTRGLKDHIVFSVKNGNYSIFGYVFKFIVFTIIPFKFIVFWQQYRFKQRKFLYEKK